MSNLWISVFDKLPDVGIKVLVRTNKNNHTVTEMYIPKDCYGNIVGHKEWKGSYNFKSSITHWMFIPD